MTAEYTCSHWLKVLPWQKVPAWSYMLPVDPLHCIHLAEAKRATEDSLVSESRALTARFMPSLYTGNVDTEFSSNGPAGQLDWGELTS